MDTRSAARAAKRVIVCKYSVVRFYRALVFSFPRIRVSVVEYYDADNDRFQVTVFFGAGREVSGRRRLVHDDVESLLFAGSISRAQAYIARRA